MSSELVATVYNNCVYAGHHVDPTTHAKTGKQVFVMMSTMKAANGTTTTTIRCFEHPGGHDGHGAHNKRIQLNGGIKALEIDSEIKALCDAQLLEADCKGRMKWVIRSIIQGSIKAKTYTLEQLRQPGCFKQQQGASHILPKSDPLVENPGRLANPPPEPRGRSSTNPVPTEMPAAKHVVETTENEDGVNIKAKEISGPSTDGRRDDVNDTAGINTGSGSTNGDQGAHDAIKHVGTEAAGKDVVATSSTSGTAIAGETGEAKAKATKKRKANPEDYPKYREAMAKFREDAARRFCQRRCMLRCARGRREAKARPAWTECSRGYGCAGTRAAQEKVLQTVSKRCGHFGSKGRELKSVSLRRNSEAGHAGG